MLNIFKHIYYIYTGYINLFFSLFGFKKKIWQERYNICKQCHYNKKGICLLCGCAIIAKVKSEYPISIKDKKSIGGCPMLPPKW